MSVHELKIHSCEEGPLAMEQGQRSVREPRPMFLMLRWLPAALVAIAAVMLQAMPARAQTPTPTPTPTNPCPLPLTPGQDLVPVPELAAGDNTKKLRGTLMLGDQQEWMTFRVPVSAPSDSSRSQCSPQQVRIFRGVDTVRYVRNSQGIVEAVPYAPKPTADGYNLPMPGPTLRARLGDLIQLTFINQINASKLGPNVDRGEKNAITGCDQTNTGYPGDDKYPDCFHGSSTGNIHFHGTHTNPNSTGDNVFIEVRPLPRDTSGNLSVTPEKVTESLDKFFTQCEVKLGTNFLMQWPYTWSDLPKSWTEEQEKLLRQYDKQLQKLYPKTAKQLWPVDENQIKEEAWPQYYIGAYPYCFRLPEYTLPTWPPPSSTSPMQMDMGKAQPTNAGAGTAELGQVGEGTMNQTKDTRDLMMGQSPGTHWYHAHKHGSTAINVANGMTGAFIIEGQYDDDLNAWYGTNWTRTQPTIVINQLGVLPNLYSGGPGTGQDKGPDFSVNGRIKPLIQMRPNEVQMWRIVNTSGRAGALFLGPSKDSKGNLQYEWRQLAQDGVQFNDPNYQSPRHHNNSFLLAAGNRADLLVKALPCPNNASSCTYPVYVKNEVDPSDLTGKNPAQQLTLMSINVSGTPVDPKSHGGSFIQSAPRFPPFLADIKSEDVKGTKTIVFATDGTPNPTMHTIDGKKFDGEVGAVVLLNQVEEWKIVNRTFGPPISHPFHIHINPFQIVEIFDPNENLTDKDGKPVIDPVSKQPVKKYLFQGGIKRLTGQCYLDPFGDPDSWKPCGPPPVNKNGIWWDVFPIPSGRVVTTSKLTLDPKTGKPVIDPKTGNPVPVKVNVPGYFKMRSRFVDFTGYYVIHCHILAHEDRGMMTVVEVAPARSPYSHN